MSEERNYEAEAAEQGWTPKEDWKGPEEKWTDAQTFVERGEQIAGILKSKNAKLESRIHKLEDSNKKFGEYHKKTLEQQKQKNALKIQELEAQLAQAVTDGDGQAFTRFNKELDGLRQEQTDVPDDVSAWNQLSQEWVSENQWYTQNPKLAAYADGISDRLRAEGFTGQAYFSELTRNVHETFPEEYKNPNKSKPNSVDDAGEKGKTNSKAKTYDNLPPDAKAACDDFVSQGFMTKEQYVSQFEFE
jgi:hypothetical protein